MKRYLQQQLQQQLQRLRSSRLRRAEALTAAGDWPRAARAWRRLARNRRSPVAPTALAEYARCLLRLGRLGEARAALERALKLAPSHPLANKLLGWAAAEQEDWRLAAAQWRGILSSLEQPPAALDDEAMRAALLEALKALAAALINTGEFTEAETLLARLAALGGDGSVAERQALQLGADMAVLRLDFDGSRRAWRRLHEKYPDEARRLTDWRGFAGLDDDSQPPRYTVADLRRAADAEEALQILRYLGSGSRISRSEQIALLQEATAAFPELSTPAEAALRRDCVYALVKELSSAAELEAAQAMVRAQHAKRPHGPRTWAMRTELAVAMDDAATVAALLEPGRARLGAGHIEILRLELWLAAKRGDHAGAYTLARQLGRRRYIMGMDNRALDLRPLNGAPRDAEWRRRQDRILLFTAFRNERLFAPWFLDYYRGLGVEWFFIVDNLSNDGTAEYLAAQKDVTVFSSRDRFVATVSGTQWINELIRRYGQDNWCVYVDSDEELVLPDGASLRAFVDGMAARGEEALPAYMLDTFPADLAAVKDFQPGDAPLAVSNLIDADYFFFGQICCPFISVRGGVRQRLFGVREFTEKAPILRGGTDGDTLRLYMDNHKLSYARVSPHTGALLHHKLLREALEMQQGKASTYRMQTRLRERRQLHERYRKSGYLSEAAKIPRSPATVAYEGSAQLQRLGLLGEINRCGNV